MLFIFCEYKANSGGNHFGIMLERSQVGMNTALH